MATALDNLKLARDNIAAKLALVTDPATMLPSYSVDGKSWSWSEYYRMLCDAHKAVTEQIAVYEPFCFISQVL